MRSTLAGPAVEPVDPAYAANVIGQINEALSEARLKDIFEQVEKDGMLDTVVDEGTLRSMIIDRRDAMRDANG